MILKFDGRDIKEMRDLPRVVADTAIGKDVEVLISRKGKEETRTVKLGRLEETEPKQASISTSEPKTKEDKTVVKKTLGLDLADMSDELRQRHKIKPGVKGVVVTAVEADSPAAEKRLSTGDVIVEIAQEQVSTADEVQKRVEQLKKDGRKSALLLIANGEGELRFVAVSLQ